MDKSPQDLFSGKTPAGSPQESPVSDALLAMAPCILWAADSELCFTALSGTGLQIVNLSHQTSIGTSLQTSSLGSSPESLNAHRKALQGEGSSFEIALDGCDLSARVEPQRGTDGAVTGVLGVAFDNTERLVAERAFRLSAQSCRSLVDEVPYAVCRSSRTGQLLQVNRAMIEMLGYDSGSEAELLLRDLPSDIFADKSAFDEFLGKLLERNTTSGFESNWRCRSGQHIDVHLCGRAVRDHSGELWYLDLVAENVTEHNKLEAQWRQAQKMQAIGHLAGGVAHDFNNLLMVIQGQAELLLSGAQEPQRHLRLKEIMRASDRASSLTRQLLAFSRQQVMQAKVIDLNLVIGHMTRMLAPLVTGGIDICFIPAKTPACVKADSSQIEQVMINLALNARDAMPKGGRFTIELSHVLWNEGTDALPVDKPSTNYVLISVTDTGHGMSEEIQSQIFEPFFTTKEPGSGTGLGLSLVYGVVKQSGGQIQVKSTPERGTTFRIYLPRVSEPKIARAETTPLSLPGGNETILYAEDEDSVRKLVSEFLANLGYQVLPACDGAVALEIAGAHPGVIDLLLTDMMMPRIGGRELALKLKQSVPDLKIVFVSGYIGNAISEKSLELPNARFLPKPFSMHSLAKTLRELLDKKA